MRKKAAPLPDWEKVLFAAAYLPEALPGAVLAGESAAAAHAGHRISLGADHVLGDLTERFDQTLGNLESVAGWKTAGVQRPVQILGSPDGILTGVRQPTRKEPLETQSLRWGGKKITIPTPGEMLRIKAVLILKRNATRDYLDFIAMFEKLGEAASVNALRSLDRLYPQPSNESPLQQLVVQLASPLPYDLEETRLSEYRQLVPRWHDWEAARATCLRCAACLFDGLASSET